MIEKLDIKDYKDKEQLVWFGIISKINELVDAVNKLHKEAENNARIRADHEKLIDTLVEENNIHEKQIDELQMKIEPEKCEIPVDPYAEQQWIGCVCRFWYDNPNDTLLDYLDKIQTGKNGVEYYAKESGDWFSHCEPVKPDDDIIYKGGKDE